MTTRMAVALVAILGLVGSTLGQTLTPPPGGVTLLPPTDPATVAAADAAHPPVIPAPQAEPASAWTDRFWATGDLLGGWITGMRVPPLVSTSPVRTAQVNAGVFGTPGYLTLVGGAPVDGDFRPGIQGSFGYWLDCARTTYVEAGFFYLQGSSRPFGISSTGSVILARPFLDVVAGIPASALVSFPGLAGGGVAGKATAKAYEGGHVDLSQRFEVAPHVRLEALVGYEYLHFADKISIAQALATNAAPFVRGTQLLIQDNFAAHNDFNGGVLGLRGMFWWDRFSLEAVGKVGAGYLGREVDIAGWTLTSVPRTAPRLSNGGFLALASNSGSFETGDWTFTTELGFTFSYQVNNNLWLRLGYTSLVLYGVQRASEQIDVGINLTRLPNSIVPVSGVSHPTLTLQKSDLSAQSISLGAEICW